MKSSLSIIFSILLFVSLVSAADYGAGTYNSGVYGTGEVISSGDTSSSSQGGGGGTVSSIQFDAKILEIASPAILGEQLPFTYFIKGVGAINQDVTIDFWIEKEGEILSSGSDIIFMGSDEEKIETASLFLPSDLESGIYKFVLQVSLNSISAESHRTIELNVEDGVAKINRLFDINFRLEEIILESSDELSVIVALENFGTESITVNLTFIILDEEGKEVYREKESIVVETENILKKSFKGLRLDEGRYTLILETLYDVDVFDEFRQDFEIRRNLLSELVGNKIVPYVIGIFIGIILLLIIIFYLKRKLKIKGKESHAKYKKRIGKNLKKIKD